MLNKLLARKSLNIIGLNSGTSADGLDLAAVKVNLTAKRPIIRFLNGKIVKYPPKICKPLNDAINDRISSIDDLILLDRELGHFFGTHADHFRHSLKLEKAAINLIASHGQTVRHLPGRIKINGRKQSGTLQLGHPETIAALTGLTTIADFRQSDIAYGGEGAPITAYAMRFLFADRREHRLLINIGGISNYFLFPKNAGVRAMQASDCGPGNSLIDIISRRHFKKAFDRNGDFAARGNISRRLLAVLLSDSYLKGKYGPSTGKERFGEKFAVRISKAALKLHLNKYDVLATTTELTAAAIAGTIREKINAFNIEKVYLFGGGLKNKYLLGRLKENLPGTEFVSIKKLGYDPDYIEAICYAVMGAMTLGPLPSGLHNVTGSKKDGVAGRIVQP